MRWASNRPSLYAAFGNKKSLFRKVLDRYSKGPSAYLHEALQEPTARAVVERLFHGVVDLLTDPQTPDNLYVGAWRTFLRGRSVCGRNSRRSAPPQFAGLRKRFKRAIAEGDLPTDADADALAHFVQTVNFGLTVQASTGATRKDLLRVVAAALQAWRK